MCSLPHPASIHWNPVHSPCTKEQIHLQTRLSTHSMPPLPPWSSHPRASTHDVIFPLRASTYRRSSHPTTPLTPSTHPTFPVEEGFEGALQLLHVLLVAHVSSCPGAAARTPHLCLGRLADVHLFVEVLRRHFGELAQVHALEKSVMIHKKHQVNWRIKIVSDLCDSLKKILKSTRKQIYASVPFSHSLSRP